MLKNFQENIVIEGLRQTLFDGKLLFFESIDSTNDLAKRMWLEGAGSGTVVFAEQQTVGRGRMGRQWVSPASSNLLLSILLRPLVAADEVFVLTMLLALAGIEAVKEISNVSALIKWPNDIYVDGKKLCGILTEFSVRGRGLEYVILGLGINVNWNPENDESILYPATSLMKETGHRVSRELLLVTLLMTFESYYLELLKEGSDKFYKIWNKRSMLLGKRVSVDTPEGMINGIAERIDKKGALIVVTGKGREQRVMSGDVSVQNIE